MPFDFGTIFEKAIPAIIGGGVTLLGDRAARDANQDAVNFSTEGARRAADIYEKGYDDIFGYEQAAIDNEGKNDDKRLRDVLSGYEGLSSNYADSARGAMGDFTDILMQGDADYWNQMLTADAIHRGYTEMGAATADDALREGVGYVEGMYAPWTGAGPEAVEGMRRIATTPAHILDPSQRIAKERLGEDLTAQRAASGQRGSGHWARAHGEAMGTQEAEFYNQNRSRQIQALDLLSRLGMDASGRVASAGERASGASAGNWRAAINDMGDTTLNVQDKALSNQFDTRRRIADQGVNTEDAIAQNDLRLGRAGVDEIGEWYDSGSRRGYAEAGARAKQIGGTADARAGAEAGPAYLQAQAALANGRLTGDTSGAMASFLADMFRKDNRSNGTPAFSDD